MIVIAGHMRIDPDKVDTFLGAIGPVVLATRTEPRNVAYKYTADLDDPTLFWLFEEWPDEDALHGHFAMPYVVDFLTALPDLGIVESAVHRYEVTDKSLMG
jgi:quinol monooxygenase YgiN